ncbi:MAG TPA: lysyl oxidase family protein, partial [Thermomicrobiales bacterium]|nr:lysyl oxidase family protein [Thermomicrobiales bacterium]
MLFLREIEKGTAMRGKRAGGRAERNGHGRHHSGVRNALARIAVVALALSLVGPWLVSRQAVAGSPLYPDLRTLKPTGLYFEHAGNGHYLLRFNNTVGNYGGRLEISVDGERNIYQNVYDQKVGGNRVIHQRVASDLIYHPAHNHFHFQGFARYDLLQRNSVGHYKFLRRGSKTTFCILDYVRLTTSGPASPQYTTCGATFQGLSAGWGDTYYSALAGQAIDLGQSPLPDGNFAVSSTADPDNRLMETDNDNNVGVTYFTVRDGEISVTGTPPLCTVDPDTGQVGATFTLRCSRFGNGEKVDVYWANTSSSPLKTVVATSSGSVSASLVVPESELGNHFVVAKGRSSGKQAAAPFNTTARLTISPSRGVVGTSVNATLSGFSSGETVTIRYQQYLNGTTIVVGTVRVSS